MTRGKGRQGFTLLELLMVVVIIGILASIALPQYIKATEKAREVEALQILGALRASEIRYYALNQAYSASTAALDVGIPTTIQSWGPPLITTSGTPPTRGYATMARSLGEFAGGTLGIQFGSGKRCGTFTPEFGTTPVTCTAD